MLDADKQGGGSIERSRIALGGGRSQSTLRTPSRFGRERGRPLQKRSRRGRASACLRALG